MAETGLGPVIFPVPVDVLLVYVGSVNNLMSDGLIRHIVCGTDANRLVPGDLCTETPVSSRKRNLIMSFIRRLCINKGLTDRQIEASPLPRRELGHCQQNKISTQNSNTPTIIEIQYVYKSNAITQKGSFTSGAHLKESSHF